MPIACPLCSAELNLHNMQLLEADLGSISKPCTVQDEALVNHTDSIRHLRHQQTRNAGRRPTLVATLGHCVLE